MGSAVKEVDIRKIMEQLGIRHFESEVFLKELLGPGETADRKDITSWNARRE